MDIDFSHWGPGFDAFMAAFAGRFPRIEPRRRAASYVRGPAACYQNWNEGTDGPWPRVRVTKLRMECSGSSMRAGGTKVGHATDLRAVIVDAIGDKENAVLVVDETGFLKKGEGNWSGVAG